METNNEKTNIIKLAEAVEYADASVVSKTLIKKETGTVTLFAFDKDQGLSEHSAPFDACVQVIDGEGQVIINGIQYQLTAGEFIIMPANIPHAIKATEKFKMMLTMIKG